MENPIIVITGPTASGKTAISFALAKKFKGEIVAADSMTIYRGMDIGTDKPTVGKNLDKEAGHYFINGITHHMLDILDPSEEFNVSFFKDIVSWEVKGIHERKKLPFLVGGSVLYLDAYIYDYSFPKVEPDEKLRRELEKKSNVELYEELSELDPDAAWTIDKNNTRRVIRALEVIKKTGQAFSEQKTKRKLPENVLYLAVERDREELYERINQRVDEMMNQGFLDEVEGLYKKYDSGTALQAAGYKQLVEYLEGKISLGEAVEKTKQAHRNYAKRQLTWLKRNKDVIWIKNQAEASTEIEKFLSK